MLLPHAEQMRVQPVSSNTIVWYTIKTHFFLQENMPRKIYSSDTFLLKEREHETEIGLIL